jgi:hypothetical protein
MDPNEKNSVFSTDDSNKNIKEKTKSKQESKEDLPMKVKKDSKENSSSDSVPIYKNKQLIKAISLILNEIIEENMKSNPSMIEKSLKSLKGKKFL